MKDTITIKKNKQLREKMEEGSIYRPENILDGKLNEKYEYSVGARFINVNNGIYGKIINKKDSIYKIMTNSINLLNNFDIISISKDNLDNLLSSELMIIPDRKINHILFDLGGVVFRGNIQAFFEWINDKYGFDIDMMHDKYAVSFNKNMDLGLSSMSDEVERYLGHTIDQSIKNDIDNEWSHVFRVSDNMLNIIHKLKCRGYFISALSNIDRNNGEKFKMRGYFRHFDSLYLSYETKYVKPDPCAFNHVKMFSIFPAEETLFIDDCTDNIEIANESGFKTLLYNNNTFESDIEKILGEVL